MAQGSANAINCRETLYPPSKDGGLRLSKNFVFPTICVLTLQNTDVRKFPCGNFLPLKVSKPRYTPPVLMRLRSKRFFMRAAARLLFCVKLNFLDGLRAQTFCLRSFLMRSIQPSPAQNAGAFHIPRVRASKYCAGYAPASANTACADSAACICLPRPAHRAQATE